MNPSYSSKKNTVTNNSKKGSSYTPTYTSNTKKNAATSSLKKYSSKTSQRGGFVSSSNVKPGGTKISVGGDANTYNKQNKMSGGFKEDDKKKKKKKG